MKNGNRVHTIRFINTLAANTGATGFFFLQNLKQAVAIRSIYFDVHIRNNVTNEIIPFEQNEVVQAMLTLENGIVNTFIAGIFSPVAGMALFNNGNTLQLYHPQQIQFDGFYVPENLQFTHTLFNYDLANAYRIETSIAVEIKTADTY